MGSCISSPLGSGRGGRGTKVELLLAGGCITDILLPYGAGFDGRPTTRMEMGRRGEGEGDTFDGSSTRGGRGGSFLIDRVGESAAEDAEGGVEGEARDGETRTGGIGSGGRVLTVPDRVRDRSEGEDVAL